MVLQCEIRLYRAGSSDVNGGDRVDDGHLHTRAGETCIRGEGRRPLSVAGTNTPAAEQIARLRTRPYQRTRRLRGQFATGPATGGSAQLFVHPPGRLFL